MSKTPTIGRADITVHYDGKGLPREAREIGKRAGGEAGDAYGAEFNKRSRDGLTKFGQYQERKLRDKAKEDGGVVGQKLGDAIAVGLRGRADKLAQTLSNVFTNDRGFEDFRANLQKSLGVMVDVDTAAGALDHQLEQAFKNRQINSQQLVQYRKRLTEMVGPAREAEVALDAMFEAAKRESAAIDERKFQAETRAIQEQSAARREIKKLIEEGDALRAAENKLLRDGESRSLGMNSALADLRGSMAKLNPSLHEHSALLGRINSVIGGGSGTETLFRDLGREAESLATKTAKAATSFGTLNKKTSIASRFFKSLKGLFSSLSQFDPADNLGQLIALIIAFLPTVTVLASSAAAGLLILAGAFGALVVAAGGLALGFSNVRGPLDKIPKSARGAVSALQDLIGHTEKAKDSTGKLTGKIIQVPGAIAGLRSALQGSLFEGLEGPIRRITATLIPALEDNLRTLGGALNIVLKQWAADLASADFKKQLKDIFTALVPIIENFGKIISNTFGIVGQLFIDIAPDVQDFTDDIRDATSNFLTFLESPKGHKEVRDWIDGAKVVIKKFGDALVVVGAALEKLLTPDNIDQTTQQIGDLGDAIANLVQVGDDLGPAATGITSSIKTITDGAAILGNIFDPFLTGTQIAFEGAFVAVRNFGNFFHDLVFGTFATSAKAVTATITAMADASHGDFAGAKKAIEDYQKAVQQNIKDISNDFGKLEGQNLATFNRLATDQQKAALKVASNFQLSGDKAKEFGGVLSDVAYNSDVSLSSLANDTSLSQLASDLGITGGAAKSMFGQFFDADGNIKISLKDLESSASKNLAGVNSKLGATGGASDALKKIFLDTAGKSKGALLGLANAKSWADIQNALGLTGTKSRTDFANKLIKAMNDSGISIDSLPPKIADLVRKYGTIPLKKNTDVTVTDDATSKIRDITSRINAIKDRNVRILVHYEQTGTNPASGGVRYGTRYGGVMAGGKRLAGGERLAFAAGGVLNRPAMFGNILAGEAGPEAIVPLTGPISRVDKSVRALSAFARGSSSASVQQSTSAGRQTNIAAGAIVVQEAGNGQTTATAVLDRLAARL